MHLKRLIELQKLLNTKKAGIICVLAAILNKCMIALMFSSLNGDKALYLLFAQSFLKTGILAEPVQMIETGKTIYFYEPAVHSPLYSLIAAPVLWLTNSFFITQFFLSVLGWIIFYTGIYKIAAYVFQQRWLVHLFILFTGFFLYPHELSSTPKDTLAVGLALWSIVLMHRFILRPKIGQTVTLALMLSFLASVKLLYLPTAVVLIFLLFVFLFQKLNKEYFFHAFLLLTIVSTAGFLVYIFILQPAYHLATHNPVVLQTEHYRIKDGFYPGNLLHAYPFISSSVINTELWGVQIEKLTSIDFSTFIRYLRRLDILLFIVVIIVSLYYSGQIIWNRILFFLVGAALIMIGVTGYLSATKEPVLNRFTMSTWTFVYDARSFLIPMLTLQLVLFLFVFRYKRKKFLRTILLLLFAFEFVHGAYFTVKQMTAKPFIKGSNKEDNLLKEFYAVLKKEGVNDTLRLVTSNLGLRRYAQVTGVQTFAFSNLQPDFSWMKKGDVYIFATYPGDSTSLKKFEGQNLRFIDTLNPYTVHSFEAK